MKIKLTLYATLLLLTVALSLRADDLVVTVQIDGHSRLIISTGDNGATASQITWDHLFGARPGTAGGELPTTLNGYGWFPTWPDTPNGSPGLSSPLTDVSVTFSTNAVTLSQEAGRTGVTIVQQPAAENAFTLVVDFDDSAPAGADQYAITLGGVSFTLLPRVSAYVSCIDVAWPTETNRLYQLQYAVSFPADWADLGPPIPGTGTNVVYTDSVVGEPRRFYRVLPLD